MKRKILLLIIFSSIFMLLLFPIIGGFLLLDYSKCSREKLQSELSPNGKFTINTYRVNCHATIDFSIEGELCDSDNNCKQIYDGYHERDSLVYWKNDKNVFINNKTLNPFKEEYDWRKDEDYYDKIYKKEN